MLNKVILILATCLLLFSASLAWASSCTATFTITYSINGKLVTVSSSKDLSHVILTFCDGTTYKFDNLNVGRSFTFAKDGKQISSTLAKAGCSTETESRLCQEEDCLGVPNGTTKVDLCGVCGGDNSTCIDCSGVPNGVAKVDLCGVCGGDNSTCVDCLGVPNGTAKVDECGVCAGNNSTCLDCAGIPNGNLRIDECGVCGGDNSTCVDCLGVPNGTAKVDECGVCNGQNNTCLDCLGTPNGSSKLDLCGVCAGDSTSCLDCAGTPNGTSKVDACGVCNGDNTKCLDCLGTPNGSSKLDLCGVCAGDSTSCLDCAGTPNGTSKVDACGVCNGNNSCFDCADIPNGGTIVDRCGVCGGLDGQLVTLKINKKQLVMKVKTLLLEKVLKYFSMASRCSKNWRDNSLSIPAKRLYKQISKLINSLQTKVRLCPGECAKSINSKTMKKINKLLDRLLIEARVAQLGARNACKVTTPPGSGGTGRDIRDVQTDVNACTNHACN